MLTRRHFLACAPAAAAVWLTPVCALADSVTSVAITAGLAALDRHRNKITFDDVIGVVDFSRHSRSPRFHLVERMTGRVTSIWVAHGRGSDPAHTGYVERFSNLAGSHASSNGSYVTGQHYIGQHGRSMRLHGLEDCNSNAEARAIVVHAAQYVSAEVLQKQGKLGRSEGCFAVQQIDLDPLLAQLGAGRLLYGFSA